MPTCPRYFDMMDRAAFWLLWALCVAFFLLGGCAGMSREIVTMVQVPIAVPCAVSIGEDPKYADTKEALRAAPGIDVRVNLLLAGRIQRDKRIDELKASVVGCVFGN